MKRSTTPLRLSAFLLPVTLLACSTTVYRDSFPANTTGTYDTSFPFRNCGEQLAEIGESVKLLGCVAYYKTYGFSLDKQVQASALTPAYLAQHGGKPVFSNNSASGTATIISYDQRRILLITCAHVVDFPDSVMSHYADEARRPTPFLRSFSVKVRQTNYVGVLPEGGELEIVALDKVRDIALLGHHYDNDFPLQFPVFRRPLGEASDLTWGSFVYLFGYPSGYKMVTKGVVSLSNKDKNKTFYVDAVLSRGYSGGLAIAVRNGVPNFELVGMVKMVLGHTEYSLVPPPTEEDQNYDASIPYRGDVYVERQSNIQYGVGQAVSIDAMRDFLSDRLPEIENQGYRVPPEWLQREEK